MAFKFSQRSLDRMVGVDQRLVDVAARALEISPIDFGIPQDGGIRTDDRQFELYSMGKSKADGYTKKSRHQSGDALDVYAYVDGKASWKKEHLAIIAAAMLQAAIESGVKVKWGGHFKSFYDAPHFELFK
jgi:hypothetical protein